MVEDGMGCVVVARLHRMVRHGYRPWLGYAVASGQDRSVELKRKDGDAVMESDGTVRLGGRTFGPGDAAGFDAAFPPDTPNRRNLLRRLYEIGV